MIYTRHDKFEGGESLDDLACRAEEAIDTTVWPHVVEALIPRPPAPSDTHGEKGRPEDAYIVLVSHELTIPELIAAREYLLNDTMYSSNHSSHCLAIISNPGLCSPPQSTKIFLLTWTQSKSLERPPKHWLDASTY
jgi:hypothetical protein